VVRRRLTTSILLLVAATLVLAAAAGVYVARRDAFSTARRQLVAQAEVIVEHPAVLAIRHRRPAATHHPVCCVELLRVLGGYRALRVARLHVGSPGGPYLTNLPKGVVADPGDVRALAQGATASGRQGPLVYAMLPITLLPGQRDRLGPLGAGESTVLVATRRVVLPVSGVTPFLLIAIVALLLATAVAYWLASRFSRPLAQAVHVTRRIAGGAFEARVPAAPSGMPELDALGHSINSMAEDLARTRAQQQRFLLSISHDLRTPLTSIRGYAEAIVDGAAPDAAAAAGIIAEESGRLERLVADLLDLARLDARRFSLQPQTVDLADATRAAGESARPRAESTGLELVVAPSGPVPARADPDRLRQLLTNLMDNAIRFARRTVTVGATMNQGVPTLWVMDDGVGIPPGDLPLVFQPYFRTGSGTGLGLAIVQELAVAMEGSVEAESPLDPNGSTRITVRLPPADPGT